MASKTEFDRLDFADWVRPGDLVVWGQASGEPLPLTERLMAQRHAIGPFQVFTGICHSATPDPQFTDTVRFLSYHGGGSNQRLGERLEIFPCHYSALPEILASKVSVLLLQLSPPDANGNFSVGVTQDYLSPADRPRARHHRRDQRPDAVARERAHHPQIRDRCSGRNLAAATGSARTQTRPR